MDKFTTFIPALFARQNRKATLILLYALIAITIWKYLPASQPFADENGIRIFHPDTAMTFNQFTAGMTKIFWGFLLMGVGPALIIKAVFRESLYDYGLQWGIPIRTFRTMAIMLPFLVLGAWFGSGNHEFYHSYPYNPAAGCSWMCFVLHALSLFFLYYLAWEFMFRGFVQKGLEQSCGLPNAVLIQVALSTMLHYGCPSSEVWGSLIGGLFWGFLAIRTQSIVSGWAQHAALGIAMDAFLILRV